MFIQEILGGHILKILRCDQGGLADLWKVLLWKLTSLLVLQIFRN